jgi:alkylhydroperoxidase family enzyme
LAGYAVECALKVALMEVAGVNHLRDLETWLRHTAGLDPDKVLHNIEVLSEHHPGVKRLLAKVNDPAALDLVRARNDCNRWHPSERYSAATLDQESAKRRLNAVDQYCKFIRNSL